MILCCDVCFAMKHFGGSYGDGYSEQEILDGVHQLHISKLRISDHNIVISYCSNVAST
jgi:hypothetical protein